MPRGIPKDPEAFKRNHAQAIAARFKRIAEEKRAQQEEDTKKERPHIGDALEPGPGWEKRAEEPMTWQEADKDLQDRRSHRDADGPNYETVRPDMLAKDFVAGLNFTKVDIRDILFADHVEEDGRLQIQVSLTDGTRLTSEVSARRARALASMLFHLTRPSQ